MSKFLPYLPFSCTFSSGMHISYLTLPNTGLCSICCTAIVRTFVFTYNYAPFLSVSSSLHLYISFSLSLWLIFALTCFLSHYSIIAQKHEHCIIFWWVPISSVSKFSKCISKTYVFEKYVYMQTFIHDGKLIQSYTWNVFRSYSCHSNIIYSFLITLLQYAPRYTYISMTLPHHVLSYQLDSWERASNIYYLYKK